MASNSKNLAELLNGDVTLTATDIEDGAVTTAKLADDAVTTTKVADTVNLGRRNMIINGAMQVAQRGTIFTTVSSGAYSCDRWISEHDSATFNLDFEQIGGSAPVGFNYSLKSTVQTTATLTSSGYIIPFTQRFERNIVDRIGLGTSDAKPFTLSFWIKSNRTGTYTVNPTLDSPTSTSGQSITKQYTIDAVDTWEYKTILFPANTNASPNVSFNAKAMTFYFWMIAGSSFTSGTLPTGWKSEVASERAVGCSNSTTTGDYWQITGVQLEVGDTATPFEHLSYGEELAGCMRYFETSFNASQTPAGGLAGVDRSAGIAFATNAIGNEKEFMVPKRSSPTMTFYRGNNSGSTNSGTVGVYTGTWSEAGVSGYNAKETRYRVDISKSGLTAGNVYLLDYQYTAEAEL